MASRTNSLTVGDLHQLQGLIKLDKSTAPTLRFSAPASPSSFFLEAVSDVAISSVAEDGSRGAHIIFRRCGDIVHPLFWTAQELRHVVRGSAIAELLAASNAKNTLVSLQLLLAEFLYPHPAQRQVDS